MRGKLLNNLQVKAIRRDYQAGNDVYTVAEWHGVSKDTVTRRTKDIRRQRIKPIDMAALRRLVEQGHSRATIARQLGCTWVAVHLAIKRLEGASTEQARAA